MGFLKLTDHLSNSIIISLEEVTSIKEEMSQTVVVMKLNKQFVVKESVDEIWEMIGTLK